MQSSDISRAFLSKNKAARISAGRMGHVSRSVYVDVLDETINPVEKVFCFDFVKHILDFMFGLFLGTSVVHFH